MTEQELIEALADKEHASWARWMDYLFSKCTRQYDGTYVIPRELVTRWRYQIETPYADLSEQEKQSDREEVAHILPLINQYVAEHADVHHHHYELGLSEQGVNDLAQVIERRIVSRLRYGRNPQIELSEKKEERP